MTWPELEEKCNNCQNCPLCRTRQHVVIGKGNREADLMFVGEAPGAQEDEQGLPFVGAAGQLFDLYMEAVGIKKEDVYIANILKCRPPNNRDPEPAEMDACIDLLRAQVRLIKPKMIVCLGRISACRLIREDFRITRERGQIIQKGSFSMMATYHPAALLRNASWREGAYADMKKIAEMFGK